MYIHTAHAQYCEETVNFDSMARNGTEPEFSVYVGNLDLRSSLADMEELLYELFLQVGPLSHVYVPYDKTCGSHRCYGFVQFVHAESVAYAVQLLNRIKLHGRPMLVRAQMTMSSAPPSSSSSLLQPQPLFPPKTSCSKEEFSFALSVESLSGGSDYTSFLTASSAAAVQPFGPPLPCEVTPASSNGFQNFPSFAYTHPPLPSHHHHPLRPHPSHHHSSHDQVSMSKNSSSSGETILRLPCGHENPFLKLPHRHDVVMTTSNTAFDSDDFSLMESFEDNPLSTAEQNSSFMTLEGSFEQQSPQDERSRHLHETRAAAHDRPPWIKESVKSAIFEYHLNQLGSDLQRLRKSMEQRR